MIVFEGTCRRFRLLANREQANTTLIDVILIQLSSFQLKKTAVRCIWPLFVLTKTAFSSACLACLEKRAGEIIIFGPCLFIC